MFDYIHVTISDLPENSKISQYQIADTIECQTKSIERSMGSFKIENKKLFKKFYDYDYSDGDSKLIDTFWLEYPFHEHLIFYSIGWSSNSSKITFRFEYKANFNRGVLQNIEIIEESRNNEKL
jgi:hypothetical protein